MKSLLFVNLGIASLAAAIAEKIGDSCQSQSVVCAFGDGNTPLYLKCDQGKYVQQACPDDSICIGARDNTVLCGYGRTPANVTISRPNTIVSSADKQETIIPPFTTPFSMSSTSTSPTPVSVKPSSNVAFSTFPPLPNQFASQIKTLSGNLHSILSNQQQQLTSRPPSPQYSLVHRPFDGDVVAVAVRPPTSTLLVTQQLPEPHWTVSEKKEESIPVSVAPTFLDSPGAALASSTDQIGGIKAQRILSVIGNILMSQHNKPAAPTPAQTPLILKNSNNNNNNNPVSLPPKPVTSFSPVMECSPGQFVCEAHGTGSLYFACDTVGMALPATCGNEEVCYQYGKSIICAPPGWRNLPLLSPPSYK